MTNDLAYRFTAAATGVGGHFLNGDRKRGYGFLGALLAWPVLYVLIEIALAMVGNDLEGSVLGSLIFAVGFIAIWTISTRAAWAYREKQTPAQESKPRGLEFIVSTVVVYAAALYCAIALVWAPHLRPGDRIELLTFSRQSSATSTSAKTMPIGDSDVVFAGTLLEKERRLGNATLVLLFQDGFRTAVISTNDRGEFEYRLPAGQWRFVGPLVSGHESRPVYVVFSPSVVKPEFFGNVGTPTKRIEMKIVLE